MFNIMPLAFYITCIFSKTTLFLQLKFNFLAKFLINKHEIKIYVTILTIICETQGDGIYLSITTRCTYSSL
jgi:hypothetical protein